MTTNVQIPLNRSYGNGSVKDFPFAFTVPKAEDLKVYIDDIIQVTPTNYTVTNIGWAHDAGTVSFVTAPPDGSVVTRRRKIVLDRKTDYQTNAEMIADLLDEDLDRVVMMIQDTIAASITIDGNELDANMQRIKNLLDPLLAQDAATKNYVDTSMTSQVAQATAEAITATVKAGEAAASAANALAYRDVSLTQAGIATTKAAEAAQSAADALAYRNTANSHRVAAAASETAAAGSATTATTQAGISTTKAAESAASALASHNDAAYSAATKQEIIDALADGSVASINGRGGLVVLTATDVGLELANNTPDINKPISTLAQAAITAANPAGNIQWTARGAAPTGWLKANGAAISRTTYAGLFAAIGTTYGTGDGSTTFNVPDLRGEFIRGLDDGRGVDASRVIGSAQAGQNASHVHGINDSGHAHAIADPGHAHGVYDPGHAHSAWTDAQGYHDHANGITRAAGAYGLQLGSPAFQNNISQISMDGGYRTDAGGNHGHNVGIGGAGTNIGIYGAGTGIGIHNAGTGISIQAQGGTEPRPRNVALLAIIKF